MHASQSLSLIYTLSYLYSVSPSPGSDVARLLAKRSSNMCAPSMQKTVCETEYRPVYYIIYKENTHSHTCTELDDRRSIRRVPNCRPTVWVIITKERDVIRWSVGSSRDERKSCRIGRKPDRLNKAISFGQGYCLFVCFHLCFIVRCFDYFLLLVGVITFPHLPYP